MPANGSKQRVVANRKPETICESCCQAATQCRSARVVPMISCTPRSLQLGDKFGGLPGTGARPRGSGGKTACIDDRREHAVAWADKEDFVRVILTRSDPASALSAARKSRLALLLVAALAAFGYGVREIIGELQSP